MEKKIAPFLSSHFGNERKTRMTWVLLGFLLLGASSVFAEETVKKGHFWKQTLSLEGRGFVNMLTSPGELVNAYVVEKRDHPKSWPATYLPRAMMNFWARMISGVSDVFIPWYAWATQDTTPLTRRFDLPDYIWQKE